VLGFFFLEFNEICQSLPKRWMDGGELLNFSALYQSSRVFTISPTMWLSPDYLETLDAMVLDPSRTAL